MTKSKYDLWVGIVEFLGMLALLALLVVALAGCERTSETVACPTAPVVVDATPAVGPNPQPPQPEPQPPSPRPEPSAPPAPQPHPQPPSPKPAPTPLPSPQPVCLCHNSKVTLCDLSSGAWEAHMKHGDTVGVCR